MDLKPFTNHSEPVKTMVIITMASPPRHDIHGRSCCPWQHLKGRLESDGITTELWGPRGAGVWSGHLRVFKHMTYEEWWKSLGWISYSGLFRVCEGWRNRTGKDWNRIRWNHIEAVTGWTKALGCCGIKIWWVGFKCRAFDPGWVSLTAPWGQAEAWLCSRSMVDSPWVYNL